MGGDRFGTDFVLDEVLAYGALPEVFGFDDARDKRRFLRAYADTYLREEINVEQIVRNLPPFRRFLDLVGAHTTEIINYSNWARDINSHTQEIDLIIEKGTRTTFFCAIESTGQSTNRVDERHARTLNTLANDLAKSAKGAAKLRILSRDQETKRIGEVTALPWREGLAEILSA